MLPNVDTPEQDEELNARGIRNKPPTVRAREPAATENQNYRTGVSADHIHSKYWSPIQQLNRSCKNKHDAARCGHWVPTPEEAAQLAKINPEQLRIPGDKPEFSEDHGSYPVLEPYASPNANSETSSG